MTKIWKAAWLGWLLAGSCAVGSAQAATQPVLYNLLNVDGTVITPLAAGDVLRLDTFVTTETGPLDQTITFTLLSGVAQLVGQAAWEISTAAGPGPRLIGVNIDIVDATENLVTSDAFVGVLGGFAHSTFASAIGPGTYTLRATGTGVRESSLDLTLAFLPAVPEPGTAALIVAGLIGVAVARSRARRPAT